MLLYQITILGSAGGDATWLLYHITIVGSAFGEDILLLYQLEYFCSASVVTMLRFFISGAIFGSAFGEYPLGLSAYHPWQCTLTASAEDLKYSICNTYTVHYVLYRCTVHMCCTFFTLLTIVKFLPKNISLFRKRFRLVI